MGTKTAVSFANIFMAEIETNLKQQSYIKDTTDFINFIEKAKIGQDTIMRSGRLTQPLRVMFFTQYLSHLLFG